MDKFAAVLHEQFGATLADNFQRRALYNSSMDFIEYVAEDTTVVADRVDDFLTTLRDADNRSLIGFRLKGFGYVFHTHLKDAMELDEEHFNPIIYLLESFFTDLGDKIFGNETKDQRRKNAYLETLTFAKQHKVAVPEELKAAA